MGLVSYSSIAGLRHVDYQSDAPHALLGWSSKCVRERKRCKGQSFRKSSPSHDPQRLCTLSPLQASFSYQTDGTVTFCGLEGRRSCDRLCRNPRHRSPKVVQYSTSRYVMECLVFKQIVVGKHDYHGYRDSRTLLLQLDTFIFLNLDKELQKSYISSYNVHTSPASDHVDRSETLQ